MNEQTIEKLLQKTPRVPPPNNLLKDLQANIELARATATSDEARLTRQVFRRWLPALGFALWFLGCIVVFGIQASRIAELKRANESGASALTPLQQSQALQESAQSLTKQLEQLRKDAADAQRLRAEIEQLRAQANELETLRAQNQQLRAELKPPAAPAPKPEEDFFAVRQEQASRIKCINNLKQVGLAARMWANESKTDAMPTNVTQMLPHLGRPERAEKLLRCPADETTPYELLSPGASESDPAVVFVRCPIHNNAGLVDGSAQQLGNNRRVVQRNGRWIIEGQP